MKLVFADQSFSYQLLRTIGHSVYGGADIGECLATAARIEEGDLESWYTEWLKTADRVRTHAEASLQSGQSVSARRAYLRACNYYRTAEFFLHHNPADSRILNTWQSSQECFSKAASLLSPVVEAIAIPYENTTLPGYFYRVDASGHPRPTLIVYPGFDSTLEELHFFAAAAAVMQGYNCLTFSGPGQGQLIRQQGIPFRPDWEAVVIPVLDYALTYPDVNADQLVLVGHSFGGLLAVRAIAHEPRFAACVVHGGILDMYQSFLHFFPESLQAQLKQADDATINTIVNAAMNANAIAKVTIGHGMWVFGAMTPAELLRIIQTYTLKGIAETVSCPTLVVDAAQDHFLPTDGRQIYETLAGPKDYLLFEAEEGAEEHCQVGALLLFHERLFEWLNQCLMERYEGSVAKN
jgi:dienelactone hydrolase